MALYGKTSAHGFLHFDETWKTSLGRDGQLFANHL